jgi:hypothetical protein
MTNENEKSSSGSARETGRTGRDGQSESALVGIVQKSSAREVGAAEIAGIENVFDTIRQLSSQVLNVEFSQWSQPSILRLACLVEDKMNRLEIDKVFVRLRDQIRDEDRIKVLRLQGDGTALAEIYHGRSTLRFKVLVSYTTNLLVLVEPDAKPVSANNDKVTLTPDLVQSARLQIESIRAKAREDVISSTERSAQ